MKKALAMLVALTAALSFFACQRQIPTKGYDAPTQTVSDFLEAVKAYDHDRAEEYLASSEEVFFMGLSDSQFEIYTILDNFTDGMTMWIQNASPKTVYSFTYSNSDADTAQVRAYVKQIDGTALLTSALNGYREACVAAGLKDGDYPDLAAYLDERIVRDMRNDPPKYREIIAVFDLKKTDGKWLILPGKGVTQTMTCGLFENEEAIIKALEAMRLTEVKK